jgi:dGTP triphosphohydrolase
MDNFDFKQYLTEGKIHKDFSEITEKKDSKKGNESEQKRMEGAIKDDRDHIKNLKKDIEDNESKLAKLKKDYKKDVIKEEEEEVKTSSKMKVSELKAKIKEDILAELSLSEADEEVDVDIDVEDEVDVDVEADDIEIERKGTTAKVEVGLSPEEEIIQDSLKAAMDSANALGNDKLADQIGNTITFFTREYVVGDRS